MDKEAENIYEMTDEEAQIIIGNIPVYPDDCYSIAEYQWAKGMAIRALAQADILDKIKAEIEDLAYYSWEVSSRIVIDDVLKIINKYKVESEKYE